MNNEIVINIVNMLNVVVCLIIIVVMIWQNSIKRKRNAPLLTSMMIIFLLLIWLVISPLKFESYIILFTQLIILYLFVNYFSLLKGRAASPKPIIYNDQSQLISHVQEQERSRIYANLHDDVGAKLLELIYSAQDDVSKKLAKEVLHDIRQAVASTQNIHCTVKQLADEIITESHSRFEPTGIKLVEVISVQDEKKKLAIIVPSVVSRIVREVVSNIIKHAKATEVQMRFVSTHDFLEIQIKDNGIGFSQNNKSGKGLKTIRKRAKSIAAEVKWQSMPNEGTVFILNYKYGDK